MFNSVVAQAKRAVTDTAERLLGRVAVALLLVMAAGFAVAALIIKLTEMWGSVIACLVVAGLFAFIAIITAMVMSSAEQKADEPAAASATEGEAQGDDLAGTITSLVATDPLTLVSAAGTAVGVFRALGRRTSLLILALLAAAFIWSRSSGHAAPETAAAPPPAPAE